MNDWRQDFSDLTDGATVLRIVIRLAVAAVLGGVLGFQREATGKAAGLRTHIIVALGAAIATLVPTIGGMTTADASRVMQGIITGIGFLGAGTILKGRDESHVQGLTTAAGIWMTAAVGMAAGAGRLSVAILGAICALIVLVAIPHVPHSRDDERR
jgi:putative Mg2+ transporter-C (MgtC) family protein